MECKYLNSMIETNFGDLVFKYSITKDKEEGRSKRNLRITYLCACGITKPCLQSMAG